MHKWLPRSFFASFLASFLVSVTVLVSFPLPVSLSGDIALEVVSVTGKRYFKNRDKICDVEINYFINRDNGSLQFNSAYIDGSKIDEVEVLKMKIIAFSTVDSTSL